MPVPSPPRPWRARSCSGETPSGRDSSEQGQKGFSGSSPPTGGKGPGRPRARRLCDGADEDRGGRTLWGPDSRRTGSHRPGGPAAPLPPSAASCGPARPRWRRQDGGAGRRQGLARNHSRGRRATGAGGRNHLGAAGEWGRRPRFEVGGRGEAWPGPAPFISAWSLPLSDLDGPAAGPGCERRLGGGHLHVVSM